MYTYIKKNVKGNYVELPEMLTSEQYNNLGTDWVDYQQNKWVMLSEEQVAFHEANPDASIKEVWLCKLNIVTEPTRTIEDAKNEMLRKIDEYDRSDSVNNFYVNGFNAWFTPAERNNYKQSVDAAKLLGVETLSFFIGDIAYTISTTGAEQVLAQIQLYADAAFIATKQHKLKVEQMADIEEPVKDEESHEPTEEYKALVAATIEAIDSYDYTTGYPTMLNFEL